MVKLERSLLEAADAQHVAQKLELLPRRQVRVDRGFGEINRILSGFLCLGYAHNFMDQGFG
jgi:hypothetical protein